MIKYRTMNSGILSLGAFARSVFRSRELLLRLARREYDARFRGSVMGLTWAVLTPLLLAVAYSFVFAGVFKLRWVGTADDMGASFAVYLLAGLAVHGILAECLARAPGLILSNPSYVTKVIFPLEILAFTVLLPSLANALITVSIVVIINFAMTGQLRPTLILAPLILAPYALFVVAVTMIVSALGVYLRDMAHVVGLILTLSLFLSPVFYALEAVPPAMQALMLYNPLTFPIEQLRQVILIGNMPNWIGLAIYLVFAVVALTLAHTVFQRLRKGFADVI